MTTNNYYNKGYTLLLGVLVIGAVALSVALSLLVFGTDYVGVAGIGFSTKQSNSLANACAEDALQELKDDSNYAGSEVLSFEFGQTCTIHPLVVTGSQSRVLQVEGASAGTVRRIEIIITALDPEVVVSSWEEVASF